ncbi:unnamed protein product [Effrenium voratum]|nr:unnamed protein product [Effrenium voratum]
MRCMKRAWCGMVLLGAAALMSLLMQMDHLSLDVPPKAPQEMSQAKYVVSPSEARAAVLLIGGARAMVWKGVCENIRDKLVAGLQQPAEGLPGWKVDVFFFLALEESPEGKNSKNRLQHTYQEFQLQHCKQLLQPVYTEIMPPTYAMPATHDCPPGHEPNYAIQTAYWKLEGASERMYSQCKRVQEAYDYLFQVFEPKAGVRYSAVVRARPDSVYLAEVPSLWTFDLGHYTVTAASPADHWHVVHRGCTGPKRRHCLRCEGYEFDEACPNRTIIVDSRVQAVVARERPLHWAKKLNIAPPKRSGDSKEYGILVLECDRWQKWLMSSDPELYEEDPQACQFFQGLFLDARPVVKAPKGLQKPGPAVAVLIIGAARALVWPQVCQNIKEQLVDGLADGVWKAEVFFFLALEDSDQARDKTQIRHAFQESDLELCRQVLQPKHVELMPPKYAPSHSCPPGKEPWYVYPFYHKLSDPSKEVGASDRVYSQCARIQLAYDFVQNVYEPKVGFKYDAFVRARPDSVFVRKAPAMSSLNISELTVSSSAPGDHWHLIHRNCTGPFERKCLRCKGEEFDGRCRPAAKRLEPKLQAVVAREKPAEEVRQLLGREVPARDGFGYLVLECDRWAKILNASHPKELSADPRRCERLQEDFLNAQPPSEKEWGKETRRA